MLLLLVFVSVLLSVSVSESVIYFEELNYLERTGTVGDGFVAVVSRMYL